MTRSIRRQLRFLHAYAVTTSLILVVLAVAAALLVGVRRVSRRPGTRAPAP